MIRSLINLGSTAIKGTSLATACTINSVTNELENTFKDVANSYNTTDSDSSVDLNPERKLAEQFTNLSLRLNELRLQELSKPKPVTTNTKPVEVDTPTTEQYVMNQTLDTVQTITTVELHCGTRGMIKLYFKTDTINLIAELLQINKVEDKINLISSFIERNPSTEIYAVIYTVTNKNICETPDEIKLLTLLKTLPDENVEIHQL